MPLLFNKTIRAGLTVAALALLPLFGNLARAVGPQTEKRAEKEDAARKQPATTTEKDQVDLAVTVYNSNIALVRDVRQIHLPSGTFPLHFEDVAASINPATVHFRSLVDPSKLNVIEQNYEFDLLDPQKLLQKYVGKEVTLVRPEKDAGSTRWVETKAVLLANNGGPVWKIGNEIVTGMPVDSYRFPDLPENLYSRPTLVWMLENRGAESQRVEASYLTNNMSWNADYVLTVGRDEKSADLDGWVTLVNHSGVAYSNAKLQLVAGQLNRVEPPMTRPMNSVAMKADAAAPQLAGSILRISPLYAGPPHIDSEQRIEADQLTNRKWRARRKISARRGPAILVSRFARNRQSNLAARESAVSLQERRKERPRNTAACRNRARLSGRFERRRPVRR
jgi:hypothetical protein